MSIVISPIEQRKGELIQAARSLVDDYENRIGVGDCVPSAHLSVIQGLNNLQHRLARFDAELLKGHKEQNRKDKNAKKR
jgi:hypothetical protein